MNLYENECRAPKVKAKASANPDSASNVTALYERLSCEDAPDGESNSITNQKAFLEDFAARNGFANCRHYTDDGFSGANFNRPGWQRMIADIESGVVKTVLAKDMSRVGRNYIETGYHTEIYFAQMGVRFIAVNNGFDNANPDSTQFTGFVNVMNDWYRKDIARKTALAMGQRGQSGKPLTTNPCFGYRKDSTEKDKWVIDPDAADTVRRVFALAASGLSQTMICRTLAREQYVTPGSYRAQHDPEGVGKRYAGQQPYRWNVGMVSAIVHRREYTGETVNFKTCHPKSGNGRAPTPPEERMIFPNTHEAIVEEATWQAAQQIFHPGMKRSPGKPCVLTGLMFCGECGAPMHFQHCTESGKRHGFYRCRTYQKSVSYPARLCSANSVRVSVMTEIVKEVIRTVSRYAVADEVAFRNALEREAKFIRPDEQRQLNKMIHRKEKRLAGLAHLVKKLYEDYALGHITEERFDKLSAAYEREEAATRQSLSELRAKVDDADSDRKRTEQFLALAKKYRDCTEVTDEMIRAFVEKIVVHKTVRTESGQRTRNMEVHLRFIGNFTIPTEGTEEK